MRYKTLGKTLVIGIAAVTGLSMLSCCGGPEAAYGPNEKVTISGRFLNEKGRPLTEREIAVWVQDVEIFFFLPDFSAQTDKKGYFYLTERGKHFMWGSGKTKYTTVANVAYNDGPVTSMSFYPVEAEIELPDARLWAAKPNENVEGGAATFNWESVDRIAGQSADRYEFTARGDSDWYLWHEDNVGPGFSLPAYLFQNRCTGWRVSAEIDREDSYGIDWSYRSAARTGKNLLPDDSYKLLSAGKPCYADGYGATRFSTFTNLEWNDTYSFDTLTAWLMLDLGEVKRISAVAVYDLGTGYDESPHAFDSFEIYVARDTANWGRALVSTSRGEGYMHFEFNPVGGRYVKIQGNAGSNVRLRSLVEFSAFGPGR